MKYTVRFAHLARLPKWAVGDTVERGDVIGIMGNTGQSKGAHLHIDCVEGVPATVYNLNDIMTKLKSSKKQLDFFIDRELFGADITVTTPYLDPEYKKIFGKEHPAYDVVPTDRKSTNIHWNRSMRGTVSRVVFQPESYGNCVYVVFNA